MHIYSFFVVFVSVYIDQTDKKLFACFAMTDFYKCMCTLDEQKKESNKYKCEYNSTFDIACVVCMLLTNERKRNMNSSSDLCAKLPQWVH